MWPEGHKFHILILKSDNVLDCEFTFNCRSQIRPFPAFLPTTIKHLTWVPPVR